MSSSTDNTKYLMAIAAKLDTLISLSAAVLTANPNLDNATKAELLTLAGFTSEQIGAMLGVHPVSVRRLRSKTRHKAVKRDAAEVTTNDKR